MNNDFTKGRPKTFGLISLGCPKNTVDSERLVGELANLGWTFAESIDDVTCLIVNTCGFIRDARLESEEALREICEIKLSRPDLILVATGCLPQRDQVDLRADFPELDLIVGVGSLPDLPRLLETIRQGDSFNPDTERALCAPGRATLSAPRDPRLLLTPEWTAYMKISEGCDHSCSFCTIPMIKGSHQSRTVPDLVEEAETLASQGVRELILISQDTTAYGSDIGTNLRKLLLELDKVEGIEWIRLLYLYPGKVSPALIETIAESRHVIPYFDIPFQHSQPRILRKMDRLAPDIDPLELIRTIRAPFENSSTPACIRTTLMVGFPGETEEDFGAMLDFIENARVDRLTVFRFSSEDGTPAAELPDQVPRQVAETRMDLLMQAQQDISLEIHESWIGKDTDVLLEGETDDGRRAGRSYRDAPDIDGLVLVEGVPDKTSDGTIVTTKVIRALPYDLEAEWVD